MIQATTLSRESVHTLANVSELLFRLTESRGACRTGRPPAMHAFKGRMKQKYNGQHSMLCIGTELNLGDELDSHDT